MAEKISPQEGKVRETEEKMRYFLKNHNSICVGVSGGSDSEIILHMIADTSLREFLPKIHFVFQNTGIEYRATLRHLDYMETRYGIHIDRIRGESVVSVVRREGLPILSKNFSHTVSQASRGAPSAWEKIKGEKKFHDGKQSRFNFTPAQRRLAEYILENGIPVSDKCCDLSKKKPFHEYLKQIHADLSISGERQAEGGARATRHNCCFEQGDIDKYMPLWFWDDKTKQYYKERECIVFSDCYEVWGMKRTGCVGCPFNSRVGKDLELIKIYEPGLYKVCMKVFGESYKLMDDFEVHRQKVMETQLTMDIWEKEQKKKEEPV